MTHCDACGWDDATYQHGAICGTKTVTPRVTRKAGSVTETPVLPKGGRPSSGNALTPAEKQRAYRERKRT